MYVPNMQAKNPHMTTFEENDMNIRHQDLREIWHEEARTTEEIMTKSYLLLIKPLVYSKRFNYGY